MSLWNWNYRMTGWSSWISCVNLSRRQKEEDEDDKKQVLHQNRTEWNQVFVNHFVWPAWHHAAVKRKFELVSVLIWSWRNMIVFVQFLAVTKLAFNDTLGSWNTFFHLLSVVISMRSGKTTLRGWRRKSLKPRIGSIGYFVCLFYLSHLFDIRFFWHLAKFVEPLLNPMDMFPMWGIPLQGNGYRNGFRHVSTKEWMISYRILKNYVLLNVSLNKSRLFKWEQSFEGFQWLRLMKITWLWSHDFDRDIGSKLSFNAPCVRAMVGRQGKFFAWRAVWGVIRKPLGNIG